MNNKLHELTVSDKIALKSEIESRISVLESRFLIGLPIDHEIMNSLQDKLRILTDDITSIINGIYSTK